MESWKKPLNKLPGLPASEETHGLLIRDCTTEDATDIASALWGKGVDDLKLDHPAASHSSRSQPHTRDVALTSGDLAQ
jgi:hypothetical protein